MTSSHIPAWTRGDDHRDDVVDAVDLESARRVGDPRQGVDDPSGDAGGPNPKEGQNADFPRPDVG
jgi:hypothetical protein